MELWWQGIAKMPRCDLQAGRKTSEKTQHKVVPKDYVSHWTLQAVSNTCPIEKIKTFENAHTYTHPLMCSCRFPRQAHLSIDPQKCKAQVLACAAALCGRA